MFLYLTTNLFPGAVKNSLLYQFLYIKQNILLNIRLYTNNLVAKPIR